jgi:hypothetical protein
VLQFVDGYQPLEYFPFDRHPVPVDGEFIRKG